jgi:hypothetical protein
MDTIWDSGYLWRSLLLTREKLSGQSPEQRVRSPWLSAEIMMDVGLIYSSRDWARWLAPKQHVELATAWYGYLNLHLWMLQGVVERDTHLNLYNSSSWMSVCCYSHQILFPHHMYKYDVCEFQMYGNDSYKLKTKYWSSSFPHRKYKYDGCRFNMYGNR